GTALISIKGGEKMYVIEQDKCQKDDNCIGACPVESIKKNGDGTLTVDESCIDCGNCEPVCEFKAIHPAA
ncbi:MAG: ferredoxin family protein, partial [bacterium]|nr:ferredoxin family protein [bacterium]